MFNRRDAETQRSIRHLPANERDSRRILNFISAIIRVIRRQKVFLALCLCVSAVIMSCSSRPADLRTLIPADSLIYLESNDLGAVMTTITERPAFREAAKTIPDFSALNGVKLAVAVTGFESKEQPVTDENSVLSFQPRFVAILETNVWNFQALAFTEHKLGEFINNVYGGEVELNISDKNDGRYFVWTAQEGRKAYALVQGSLVFFGNDESAIDKCLAIKRGEAESIATNPKIAQVEASPLARGFVSKEGVDQISSIVGLSMASQIGEEEEVKRFVAEVLPKILRSTISDVSWTALKTDSGIEDRYLISTPNDVSNVLNETMVASDTADTSVADLLPKEPSSATLYNFKDPQVAWRSILFLLQKQAGPVAGNMLVAISDSMFEPYGIREPELFLKSVGPSILTMKDDESGEKLLVVAPIKDDPIKGAPKVEGSLASETRHLSEVSKNLNYDGDAFMYAVRNVYIGDIQVIRGCGDRGVDWSLRQKEIKEQLEDTKAAVITIGTDRTTTMYITSVLDRKKDDNLPSLIRFKTETRFTKKGIERRTVSDFGFIGWIITQFVDKDE